MLCLTRPAIGLALVGVCLLGTPTFAADLVAAVLARLMRQIARPFLVVFVLHPLASKEAEA